MKYNIFINCILSCLFLIVASCKKEPIDDFKSKIIGEWKYEKLVEKNYDYTGKLLNERYFATTRGEYYHFKKDGTAIQYFDQISDNTYKITSDTRFELNTGLVNPCRLVSIDKKSFVFVVEGPRREKADYIEYTHFLIK
ncbi:hypothetical protein [Pedobacter roseus]|uniref:Lipocalin family protein n=1 Tax=Pedobacter roseus TaxID=336820 RepID=A0A7G9QIH5_9SPHI|nr:hypothetical protein [Pedobacter roseus]QNN43150.1 hypothetical protein H9L23_03320 [Pedobacter roseus]